VSRPRCPRRRAAAALLFSVTACEPRPSPVTDFDPGPVPAVLAEGERRYERFCGSCHGPRAAGSDAGPPLVHRIYEPSHHADAAFQLAVTRGVRAHHWTFGNMPPVSALDPAGIASVIAYVRWLQRQAGIH
jgi:mono/diheme cytochrome c family protein